MSDAQDRIEEELRPAVPTGLWCTTVFDRHYLSWQGATLDREGPDSYTIVINHPRQEWE